MEKNRKKRGELVLLAIFLLVADIAIVLFLTWQSARIFARSDFFAKNMEKLALFEQVDHRNDALGLIFEAETDTRSLEDAFNSLKDKKAITKEDKGDLYEKIDALERDIRNIEIEYGRYITDVSVEINPHKNQDIDDFMRRTLALSQKGKRLVRYMENFIYSKNSPAPDQIALIERSFANVHWQIDSLKKK